MENPVTEEVRARRERASALCVHEAVCSALLHALMEIADLKGVEGLDTFLARRLLLVDSLRSPRPWEPPRLTEARARDATAVEAALRDVVQAARDQCEPKAGPSDRRG